MTVGIAAAYAAIACYTASSYSRTDRPTGIPKTGFATDMLGTRYPKAPPRALNFFLFVASMVVNGLAASGSLGKSMGDVSDAYPSYFSPSSFAFNIWWLIYTGLFFFVVYQLSSRNGTKAVKIGYLFVVASGLNIAWVIVFAQEWIVASFVIMSVLLATLVVIHGRIGVDDPGTALNYTLRDRICFTWPFALYLSWICVAFTANAFLLDSFLSENVSTSQATTAGIFLFTLASIAIAASLLRGLWTLPLVVGWAAVGIAARVSPDSDQLNGMSPSEELEAASYVAASVCAVFGIMAYRFGIAYRSKRRRYKRTDSYELTTLIAD